MGRLLPLFSVPEVVDNGRRGTRGWPDATQMGLMGWVTTVVVRTRGEGMLTASVACDATRGGCEDSGITVTIGSVSSDWLLAPKRNEMDSAPLVPATWLIKLATVETISLTVVLTEPISSCISLIPAEIEACNSRTSSVDTGLTNTCSPRNEP